MMFIKLLLVTFILMAIAFSLLGIRILFVKGGKFPKTSVGGNKHMRELGITCAKCEEQIKFNRMIKKKKIKINPLELKVSNN